MKATTCLLLTLALSTPFSALADPADRTGGGDPVLGKMLDENYAAITDTSDLVFELMRGHGARRWVSPFWSSFEGEGEGAGFFPDTHNAIKTDVYVLNLNALAVEATVNFYMTDGTLHHSETRSLASRQRGAVAAPSLLSLNPSGWVEVVATAPVLVDGRLRSVVDPQMFPGIPGREARTMTWYPVDDDGTAAGR